MKAKLAHYLRWYFSAIMLIACVTGTTVAEAQVGRSLKDAMFGHKSVDGRTQAPPKIAHFVSEDGESFVFDGTSPQALMRFDGDDEVWALTTTQGPKGDVIYKNDIGEPVLKATRWGGMILFSEESPTGDPAAVTGKAEAFSLDKISPASLYQTLLRASHRVSVLLERNLIFAAPDVTPDTSSLYANSFTVTSDALAKVALQSHGRQMLTPVHQVQFVDGRPPSASLDKGTLTLKLDASRGAWGGHPSSRRIMNLIMTSYSVADNDRR